MPSKPRTLAGILHPRRHADRAYNRVQRDPATARVHGSARWQRLRARVLRDEPVCRECARHGLTAPATQVDHVVPLAVGPERAYDRANCQPLCTACHARKSAAERASQSTADRSAGEGGRGISGLSSLPSGARGVSLFSRVSTLSALPAPHGQKWPAAGDSSPKVAPGTPTASGAPAPPADGLNPPLAGGGAPEIGAGRCDTNSGVSGGIASAARPLGPRDVEALAMGLAMTHDVPLAEARARVEAALARGDRVMEVPDGRPL